MEPKGTFAKRLRRLMGERGMSRAELVRRSGIAQNTADNLLKGKYEPLYVTLHALHEALGCTWEELMCDE